MADFTNSIINNINNDAAFDSDGNMIDIAVLPLRRQKQQMNPNYMIFLQLWAIS